MPDVPKSRLKRQFALPAAGIAHPCERPVFCGVYDKELMFALGSVGEDQRGK
jgi:hypothetical protein